MSQKFIDGTPNAESVRKDLEHIIDQRLDELTSQHVKIIIKEMTINTRMVSSMGWCFWIFIGIILYSLGSLN